MTSPRANSQRESSCPREAFFWRAGTAGSVLALLTFLPLPLKPQIPLCGFLWLTSRPCPFCGLTRALACLWKGELGTALSLHPLSPLAFAALLIIFLGSSLGVAWPEARCLCVPKEASRRFWSACLLLFLAYGALRFFVGADS